MISVSIMPFGRSCIGDVMCRFIELLRPEISFDKRARLLSDPRSGTSLIARTRPYPTFLLHTVWTLQIFDEGYAVLLYLFSMRGATRSTRYFLCFAAANAAPTSSRKGNFVASLPKVLLRGCLDERVTVRFFLITQTRPLCLQVLRFGAASSTKARL